MSYNYAFRNVPAAGYDCVTGSVIPDAIVSSALGWLPETMPLIISVCLVVAGAVLWVASLLIASRANPEDRLPFWRNPKNNPGRSILCRALGAGLMVAGSVYLGSNLGAGWIAPLIVIIIAIPALVIIALHNRRFTASQTTQNQPGDHRTDTLRR